MDIPKDLVKPKVFVSYCQANPAVCDWVRNLCEELVSCGVDVVFDEWDLHKGQDIYHFMEENVVSSDTHKVLMVCDKHYAEKADDRKGGVGAESQIISPQLYGKATETKFLPLVFEVGGDGAATVPVYLKSRFYIDFTDPSKYSAKFEELLRDLYSRPARPKPKLGSPPAFLFNSESPSGSLMVTARRLKNQIQDYNQAYEGTSRALSDEIAEYVVSLKRPSADHNEIFDAIQSTNETKNILADVFLTATNHELEHLASRMMMSVCDLVSNELLSRESLSSTDFDAARFFMQELILYFAASQEEAIDYSALEEFCAEKYGRRRTGMLEWVSFGEFQRTLRSIDLDRNTATEARKVSLVSHTMKQRCFPPRFAMEKLIQADLLLSLRSIRDASSAVPSYSGWVPITTLWDHAICYDLPLFSKMKATENYRKISPLLGCGDRSNFVSMINASLELSGAWSWFLNDTIEGIEWDVLLKLRD